MRDKMVEKTKFLTDEKHTANTGGPSSAPGKAKKVMAKLPKKKADDTDTENNTGYVP